MPSARTLIAGLVAVLVGLGIAVVWQWRSAGEPAPVAARPVQSLLGESVDGGGFKRATRPGEIRWPQDHGPHPDYRTEWWYFTGSLADAGGREFGFQLTFFRFGLSTQPSSQRDSPWASQQLYMAHFAVTDIAGRDHRVVERFARPAVQLAGARAQPFMVWLDDWSAASAGNGFLPLRLVADDSGAGIGLALELRPGKPPVRQGDRGLSVKGPEPGNASWYYSFTRLPAAGRLRIDRQSFEVDGFAWMDREWSSSSLGEQAVGWDWFGLQLDDGRELMLYRLRDADGRALPVSAGSLVDASGGLRSLGHEDFVAEPVATWRSERSGVEWPVAWRIELPGLPSMQVRAAVKDQEQNLSVRYWEGAVDVLMSDGGRRLGRGYMELTGYGDRPAARQANSAR